MEADERELRVGLDLRPTEEGFKAHYGRGTGRYTAELTAALRATAREVGIDLQECSTVRLGAGETERRLYAMLPYGRHTVEQQFLLPRRIDRLNFDLFHFFAHVDAPSRLRTPYVVTVLDLIPLKFAELYKAGKPDWRFRLARRLELRAVERASGIIAISEATKRDLVDLLGINPEKIVVTPLAAGARFRPLEAPRESLRQRFGLPEDRPLLLYVGGIDARKNVPFLVEVFARAAETGLKRPVLALAGRYENDDKYPQLLDAIRRCGVENDVRLLGFVSEQDLPALYCAADVFVFPSLYEGFGLPVLEAMSCGTPVIAADNSSLPEVVGSAGLLVSAGNAEAWLAALSDIFKTPGRRKELAASGSRQAARFSWQRTAELTCEAYLRFAGARRRGSESDPEESRRVTA